MASDTPERHHSQETISREWFAMTCCFWKYFNGSYRLLIFTTRQPFACSLRSLYVIIQHEWMISIYGLEQGVLHLAILSKDRALVVSDGFIRIYKMPELQSSTDLTTADPPSHCALHVIALPGGDARLGGLSRPRVHSRQTWFALYTGSGVYALKIPCDEHCPPCFSTLSDFETTEPSDACVGFRRAVVRSTYSSVFALSYACPGAKDNDSAARVTMIRHLQLPEGSMRPTLLQMDEGSGRVIQEDSGAGLSVFDFALYHRSGT